MTSRIPGMTDGAAVRDMPGAYSAKKEAAGGKTDAPAGVGGTFGIPAGERLIRPMNLTAAMVDEAVEGVVKTGFSPDLASVLMHNMANDHAGAVASQFYSARAHQRAAVAGVKRRDITIPYVLDEGQVTALAEYAPEYQLRFTSRDSHDHAFAAAARIIDHRLIEARIPLNVPITDVGGNPLTAIRGGVQGRHFCGPIVDAKDPMRHKLRAMQVKRIAETSAEPTVCALARRYLAGDEQFVCSKRAQDCGHQSLVLTSIHVYDIDIEDWPLIMQKKGAMVVEGCLLFSDAFLDTVSGEMPVSRVRYEIDVAGDKFRMGFAQSPAWWYEHAWSRYQLYGSDQVLCGGGETYSYKVIEKRGDTIFFRILKLEKGASSRPMFSSRKTPGVPLVEVNGFELAGATTHVGNALARQVYRFPRNLWYDMVNQASEDFERGCMDFGRMYNHYRTMSVRQTINAVLVMGGEQVSQEELVPLVTHACLAAAAQSLLGQRTTRGITDAAVARRGLTNESLVEAAYGAFQRLAKSVVGPAVRAFQFPLAYIGRVSAEDLSQWVLEWEPQVREIIVPLAVLQSRSRRAQSRGAAHVTQVLRDHVAETAVFDHVTAVFADEKLRQALRESGAAVDIPPTPVVEESSNAASKAHSANPPPSYATVDMDAVEAERKAAIREHINEILGENEKTTAQCRRAYAELTVRGIPNRKMLADRSELYAAPDFWYFRNGTAQHSALHAAAEDFQHSAVFTVQPDPDTGSCIRTVKRVRWEGLNGEGRFVRNVNFTLTDSTFTGWAFVNDRLVIHNGPEVIGSMEEALRREHKYRIVVREAPPGSGKTYAIIHEAKPDGTDAIMCPVRASIEDTRNRFLELHEDFQDPKTYIRTIDSYLANYGCNPKTAGLCVDRLLADECFMAHAGKWYAVAALLGVEVVHAYGDSEQIPHIPRADVPALHVRIQPQEIDHEWMIRRCPPANVAAWAHLYGYRVRTMNPRADARLRVVTSTEGLEIPDGCVMMCMYQDDKKTLRTLYAQHLRRVKIMTTHEAQGKTFEHVWLHRFDVRVRPDKTSLFDQSAHCLVAMSRNTHSFMYVRLKPMRDLVEAWIERSRDPRRLAAVQDVDSKGEALEFL